MACEPGRYSQSDNVSQLRLGPTEATFLLHSLLAQSGEQFLYVMKILMLSGDWHTFKTTKVFYNK